MKLSNLFLAKVLFVSASLATTSLSATSVTSDPVGVMFYNFPATSDINVGLGLARPSAFEGRVASVDLVNSTVTFQGNPGWATDQFTATAEQHYLYIKSGEEEGMHVTVTGNTENSITVFLDTGDRLDRLVVGEVASIVPYWTPRTFIGDTLVNGDKILFYRDRTPAMNHPPSLIIYHEDGEWYVEGTDEIASDTPIFPGEGFAVRNTNALLSMTKQGVVPMASIRIVMRSNGRPPVLQDQRFSMFTPVSFPIRNLMPVIETDAIYTFSTTGGGYNRGTISAVMYYWNDWLMYSNFLPTPLTHMLNGGQGYLYQGVHNYYENAVLLTMNQPYLD